MRVERRRRTCQGVSIRHFQINVAMIPPGNSAKVETIAANFANKLAAGTDKVVAHAKQCTMLSHLDSPAVQALHITDHGEVRIVECGRGFIRQCNAVGDILKPAPLKHKVGSKGSLHAILCGLEGAVLKTQCTKYLIVGLASQRGYLHNGIIRTGAGNRTIHSHEFAGIEGGLSQLSGDLQRLCTRHCRVDIHLLKPQILVCHVLPASILIIAIYLNACSGEESNH